MKRLLLLILTVVLVATFVSPPNTNVKQVKGKFYGCHEATDTNGNTDTYYEFRSNDGSIWWDLTECQMGFIPNENIEYIFTYDNNGTTRENKPCDCASKFNCECEVYDDRFLSVKAI